MSIGKKGDAMIKKTFYMILALFILLMTVAYMGGVFNDLTFEQAFNMMALGPMRSAGTMAEHSYDVAKSALSGNLGYLSINTHKPLDAVDPAVAAQQSDQSVNLNDLQRFLKVIALNL